MNHMITFLFGDGVCFKPSLEFVIYGKNECAMVSDADNPDIYNILSRKQVADTLQALRKIPAHMRRFKICR